jgi:hypothetical protein
MKYKRNFFWINFLKSVLLYLFIFSLARLVFNDDLDFLSTRNAAYILGISLFLSVLNAVRKSQDFKGLDEDTVDELKQRGLKFYIGFFGFLFLFVVIFLVVLILAGVGIYYLFFGGSDWDWNLLWRVVLFSLSFSALLAVYSVLSDKWKVATYHRKQIIS